MELLQKIKDNVIIGFTLSIVAAYFACIGYYLNFHLHISTFITIQDLTLIYVKWIWVAAFFVFFFFVMGEKIILLLGDESKWWHKTLPKTRVKRIALVFLVLLIILIVVVIVFSLFDAVVMAFSGIFGLMVTLAIIITIISIFGKKNITDVSLQDWGLVVSTIVLYFVFTPLFTGFIVASKSTPDNVLVCFTNSGKINTTDSVNVIYIGKTSNYFFLYDTVAKNSTAYSMQNVESFKVIPTKTKL